MNTTPNMDAELDASNPYRYAYGFGLLAGFIHRLEIEAKYGTAADMRREVERAAAACKRIQARLGREATASRDAADFGRLDVLAAQDEMAEANANNDKFRAGTI